jgi:hypothetical protein
VMSCHDHQFMSSAPDSRYRQVYNNLPRTSGKSELLGRLS